MSTLLGLMMAQRLNAFTTLAGPAPLPIIPSATALLISMRSIRGEEAVVALQSHLLS